MKNPYEDEKDLSEIRVSPTICWAGIIFFLLVCCVPPIFRNFTAEKTAAVIFKNKSKLPFTQHLRAAEKTIEDAPFTIPPRKALQKLATSILQEGNSKTIIGKGGFLFLRPGVEALTGTGPIQPPPLGPASDPSLKKAHGPAPAIKQFAADLKERGIRLLLVPIPIKPTIYPEKIADLTAPLTHPDAAAFYADLDIEILDLTDAFIAAKNHRQVYLKQDTHWTPETMQVAAKVVAAELAEFKGDTEYTLTSVKRSHIGDLVKKLEIEEHFKEEEVTLQVVSGKTRDTKSPILLLGDSFVNIFGDPAIGFGDGSEDRINAGFAEHLAAALKRPIDVIAKNGDASTGVRQDFGKRPDNEVRAKKAVIWLIAARDLFYPPKLAAENNVSWSNVSWSSHSKEETQETPGILTIEATLKRAAAYADPSQVVYPSSTYETEWETSEGEVYRVKLWAFKKSKRVPTGKLEIGKTYRLKLVPEETVPAAASAQSASLEGDPYFGDTYFSELVE